MTLDLLKRSEKGSALSATEHDANFTAIESEVNAKADVAPAAPVLITGDTTLVAATHHGKTLEISAATSPRITCAQIGAGVRCRIHRPMAQPSPRILPPNTTGVPLVSADLGMNRIYPGGTVEVEYTNGNTPQVRGNLQWGDVPTAAEYAGLIDFADLRRGEGLSTSAVLNPVTSWTSRGNAAAVFTGAGTIPPTLNADGTLRFSSAGGADSCYMTSPNVTLSGNVIVLAAAYRVFTYVSGAPDVIFIFQGTDEVRLGGTSLTAGRLRTNASSSNTRVLNTASGQWVAIVAALDRINSKAWIMTNSRAATDARLHDIWSMTGANVPDWTAWVSATCAIGRFATGSTQQWDIAGIRILENADAAVSGGEIDRDLLLRLLGQMRLMFPPGVEG